MNHWRFTHKYTDVGFNLDDGLCGVGYIHHSFFDRREYPVVNGCFVCERGTEYKLKFDPKSDEYNLIVTYTHTSDRTWRD